MSEQPLALTSLAIAVLFPTATLIFALFSLRQKADEIRERALQSDLTALRERVSVCEAERQRLSQDLLYLQRRVMSLEQRGELS